MGSKSKTTTTQSGPWQSQQPYLQAGFQSAKDLYDQYSAQPLQQYSQGLNAIQARALAGSPTLTAAQNLATNTLNGAYLNSNPANAYYQPMAAGAYLNANPYIDTTYNNAAGAVQSNYLNTVVPQLASQYAAKGRYGSGLYQSAANGAQGALAGSLSSLADQIYGDNYNTERGYQMQALTGLSSNYQNERNLQQQAITQAPALASADYVDLNAYNQAGQQKFDRQSQLYNAKMAALQAYMNAVNGNYGGTSSSTAPGSSYLSQLTGAFVNSLGKGAGDVLTLGRNSSNVGSLFGAPTQAVQDNKNIQ